MSTESATVPIWSFARRVDRRGREDSELLSVYRDHGVVPKSSRDDNFNKESEDLSNYLYVEQGDLVLNKMKTWQGSLAVSKFEGIVSPAYFVCQLSPQVEPRFIHYLLRSEPLIAEYAKRSKGIRPNQWDLPFDEFKAIEVTLPPVEEQRRIADFLDDQVARIDSAIALRGQQEALLKEEYGERVADTLLGRRIQGERTETRITPWARDMPADWREIPARFLCRIITGSGDTIDADPDGGYPFYVRSDNAEQSRSYSFDCEAVLTSGDGAGVGKVFHLVSGRFHAHQRVYVLTDFRYLSAEYFYFYFSVFFRNMALDGSAKSTVDSVRRDMIAGMPFLVPPVGVQSEIVDELLHVQQTNGHVTAALRGAVQLLEERKRALITAAVTGELDVTTAKPIGMGKWVPNVGASVDAPASAQASSIGGIG